MAERDTFSRENEFSQLMMRVNALLDADDGDDEKSLNFDAVALAVGKLALWVAGHKKDVKGRRAKTIVEKLERGGLVELCSSGLIVPNTNNHS